MKPLDISYDQIFFFAKIYTNFKIRRWVPRVKKKTDEIKKNTHISLSLLVDPPMMCLHWSLSLSTFANTVWIQIRPEWYSGLNVVSSIWKCVHATESTQRVNDFAIQKPMRTRSVCFGSSLEAVVTRLIDWPDTLRNQVRVQTPCSLSLSLYFYDLLSKFAKTVWIVRRAWSGTNMHTKSYNLVRLCVRWKELFRQVPSFRCMLLADAEVGRGSGPPWKITKI